MCGIAGFTGAGDPHRVERLFSSLRHRGPDARGVLSENGVTLVNTRLAIIDIAGGDQPIYSEDRSCAIVFNGEIYNYRELRESLAAKYRFTTASDTEVILHLYEEKGEEVSKFLRGDFAFCIFDARRRSCLLSRDHLGVKPLYYTVTTSGNLVFASELTALLIHPEVRDEIDPLAVSEYMSYLYVREPRTLIKDVFRLRPGESLVWKDGAVRKWFYWQIPDVDRNERVEEMRERTLDRIGQAVRRRLIADVPVGAFLSGGLDSSLIVALASREARGLQTFTIGFGERDFDELRYARQIADVFSTDHHELVVQPQINTLIHEVISAMDEPIGDSSAIPTFLVARECRRFVKVALSGIGGDEMFFGYPRYLGAKLSEWVPGVLGGVVARGSGFVKSRPNARDVRGWVRRFGSGLSLPPPDRYESWINFSNAGSRSLIHPDFTDASPRYDVVRDIACEAGDFLDRIFRFDVKNYLASDLLKFGDTMTMAHGLEVRVPFCDVDLVEHVARYPANVRFPDGRLKHVLRDVARDILPPQIRKRKKQGFMIPIGRWFRSELREFVKDECRRERLPGFLDSQAVEKLVDEHLQGEANHTNRIWPVIVLSLWLRNRHGSIRGAGV